MVTNKNNLSMKRTALCIILCSFVLFACKHRGENRRTMLIHSWHATKLENKEFDSFFANSQAYIDTVGKGHDAATNIALYQVANMDSMRVILQAQLDSAKKMHADAVLNTTFNFRNDSVAVMSFNGQVDSSRWYLSGNDTVILEDMHQVGGPKIKMLILNLSTDELKLKMEENNATSTVTFRPDGK
jgi:hypothetical protein